MTRTWVLVNVGARIRQRVEHGPFVVQRREDLGLGGCRLFRHRGAAGTTFRVHLIETRAELGFSCQVVHVEDETTGERYVIDTGIMGPGLPPDAFELL